MSSAYWASLLAVSEFAGSAERREIVGGILATNDFAHVRSVKSAEDPREWLGGETLQDTEVLFLTNLMRQMHGQPSPPRRVSAKIRHTVVFMRFSFQAKWGRKAKD